MLGGGMSASSNFEGETVKNLKNPTTHPESDDRYKTQDNKEPTKRAFNQTW
jgi:hypothetical protein